MADSRTSAAKAISCIKTRRLTSIRNGACAVTTAAQRSQRVSARLAAIHTLKCAAAKSTHSRKQQERHSAKNSTAFVPIEYTAGLAATASTTGEAWKTAAKPSESPAAPPSTSSSVTSPASHTTSFTTAQYSRRAQQLQRNTDIKFDRASDPQNRVQHAPALNDQRKCRASSSSAYSSVNRNNNNKDCADSLSLQECNSSSGDGECEHGRASDDSIKAPVENFKLLFSRRASLPLATDIVNFLGQGEKQDERSVPRLFPDHLETAVRSKKSHLQQQQLWRQALYGLKGHNQGQLQVLWETSERPTRGQQEKQREQFCKQLQQPRLQKELLENWTTQLHVHKRRQQQAAAARESQTSSRDDRFPQQQTSDLTNMRSSVNLYRRSNDATSESSSGESRAYLSRSNGKKQKPEEAVSALHMKNPDSKEGSAHDSKIAHAKSQEKLLPSVPADMRARDSISESSLQTCSPVGDGLTLSSSFLQSLSSSVLPLLKDEIAGSSSSGCHRGVWDRELWHALLAEANDGEEARNGSKNRVSDNTNDDAQKERGYFPDGEQQFPGFKRKLESFLEMLLQSQWTPSAGNRAAPPTTYDGSSAGRADTQVPAGKTGASFVIRNAFRKQQSQPGIAQASDRSPAYAKPSTCAEESDMFNVAGLSEKARSFEASGVEMKRRALSVRREETQNGKESDIGPELVCKQGKLRPCGELQKNQQYTVTPESEHVSPRCVAPALRGGTGLGHLPSHNSTARSKKNFPLQRYPGVVHLPQSPCSSVKELERSVFSQISQAEETEDASPSVFTGESNASRRHRTDEAGDAETQDSSVDEEEDSEFGVPSLSTVDEVGEAKRLMLVRQARMFPAVRGVYFDTRSGNLSWRCSWKTCGKKRSRSWSVLKFGMEGARAYAIAERLRHHSKACHTDEIARDFLRCYPTETSSARESRFSSARPAPTVQRQSPASLPSPPTANYGFLKLSGSHRLASASSFPSDKGREQLEGAGLLRLPTFYTTNSQLCDASQQKSTPPSSSTVTSAIECQQLFDTLHRQFRQRTTETLNEAAGPRSVVRPSHALLSQDGNSCFTKLERRMSISTLPLSPPPERKPAFSPLSTHGSEAINVSSLYEGCPVSCLPPSLPVCEKKRPWEPLSSTVAAPRSNAVYNVEQQSLPQMTLQAQQSSANPLFEAPTSFGENTSASSPPKRLMSPFPLTRAGSNDLRGLENTDLRGVDIIKLGGVAPQQNLPSLGTHVPPSLDERASIAESALSTDTRAKRFRGKQYTNTGLPFSGEVRAATFTVVKPSPLLREPPVSCSASHPEMALELASSPKSTDVLKEPIILREKVLSLDPRVGRRTSGDTPQAVNTCKSGGSKCTPAFLPAGSRDEADATECVGELFSTKGWSDKCQGGGFSGTIGGKSERYRRWERNQSGESNLPAKRDEVGASRWKTSRANLASEEHIIQQVEKSESTTPPHQEEDCKAFSFHEATSGADNAGSVAAHVASQVSHVRAVSPSAAAAAAAQGRQASAERAAAGTQREGKWRGTSAHLILNTRFPEADASCAGNPKSTQSPCFNEAAGADISVLPENGLSMSRSGARERYAERGEEGEQIGCRRERAVSRDKEAPGTEMDRTDRGCQSQSTRSRVPAAAAASDNEHPLDSRCRALPQHEQTADARKPFSAGAPGGKYDEEYETGAADVQRQSDSIQQAGFDKEKEKVRPIAGGEAQRGAAAAVGVVEARRPAVHSSHPLMTGISGAHFARGTSADDHGEMPSKMIAHTSNSRSRCDGKTSLENADARENGLRYETAHVIQKASPDGACEFSPLLTLLHGISKEPVNGDVLPTVEERLFSEEANGRKNDGNEGKKGVIIAHDQVDVRAPSGIISAGLATTVEQRTAILQKAKWSRTIAVSTASSDQNAKTLASDAGPSAAILCEGEKSNTSAKNNAPLLVAGNREANQLRKAPYNAESLPSFFQSKGPPSKSFFRERWKSSSENASASVEHVGPKYGSSENCGEETFGQRLEMWTASKETSNIFAVAAAADGAQAPIPKMQYEDSPTTAASPVHDDLPAEAASNIRETVLLFEKEGNSLSGVKTGREEEEGDVIAVPSDTLWCMKKEDGGNGNVNSSSSSKVCRGTEETLNRRSSVRTGEARQKARSVEGQGAARQVSFQNFCLPAKGDCATERNGSVESHSRLDSSSEKRSTSDPGFDGGYASISGDGGTSNVESNESTSTNAACRAVLVEALLKLKGILEELTQQCHPTTGQTAQCVSYQSRVSATKAPCILLFSDSNSLDAQQNNIPEDAAVQMEEVVKNESITTGHTATWCLQTLNELIETLRGNGATAQQEIEGFEKTGRRETAVNDRKKPSIFPQLHGKDGTGRLKALEETIRLFLHGFVGRLPALPQHESRGLLAAVLTSFSSWKHQQTC